MCKFSSKKCIEVIANIKSYILYLLARRGKVKGLQLVIQLYASLKKVVYGTFSDADKAWILIGRINWAPWHLPFRLHIWYPILSCRRSFLHKGFYPVALL